MNNETASLPFTGEDVARIRQSLEGLKLDSADAVVEINREARKGGTVPFRFDEAAHMMMVLRRIEGFTRRDFRVPTRAELLEAVKLFKRDAACVVLPARVRFLAMLRVGEISDLLISGKI